MKTLQMENYQLSYSFNFSDPHLPTVLLIHGMMTDSSQWSLMLGLLSAHANILVYDTYGHGRTGLTDKPLTMGRLVSEAHSLIDYLGADRVHLAGCGMGSNLCYELAKRYPDRVASLTLMSSLFFIQEGFLSERLGFLSRLIDVDRDLIIDKWTEDSFSRLTEEKAALFRSGLQKIPTRIIKEQIAELTRVYNPADFHFIDELSRITLPTLILHGSDDTIVPAQLAAIFSVCIPNSLWQIIPEAAQQIPLDQPEAAARLLLKFISGEKGPIHSFPIYQELTDKYLQILKSGLAQSKPDGHLLRINVLRDVVVLWNHEPIEGKWNQRGAKELLLYLILHQGTASREELISTFLADLPAERARNNLRVRINHLNQIFQSFHEPDVHEVLLIGESTLALNAEIESDIGDYLARLKAFPELNFPLKKQASSFVDLLREYDPANFSTFRSDWIFSLTDEIETNLANVLEILIPKLKAEKSFGLAREVLQSARSIEPYDGFCDEQLAEMHYSGMF